MKQYMVEIDLPSILTQEIMALVPAQRKRVNELMGEGQILSYTLSLERARLWVVVVAETRQEVSEILDTLPITPYCEAQIFMLMFHNTLSWEMPVISMN